MSDLQPEADGMNFSRIPYHLLKSISIVRSARAECRDHQRDFLDDTPLPLELPFIRTEVIGSNSLETTLKKLHSFLRATDHRQAFAEIALIYAEFVMEAGVNSAGEAIRLIGVPERRLMLSIRLRNSRAKSEIPLFQQNLI